MTRNFSRGFTLIEMLVVLAIIAILIGASIGGFSKMTKSAERAKAQELVSNVATALTVLFNREGAWPQSLLNAGKTDGKLDENVARVLATKRLLSLSTKTDGGPLTGLDRFGVVTPWATAALKRADSGASANEVKVGSCTVADHVLHFAIDLDGDGIVKGASVGGESLDVRATAIVWCVGKSGGNAGKPWPYSTGLKRDDIYSWTPAQRVKQN